MNPKISHKLETLPCSPGVYIMKNAENTVIYVGKAKNLPNRVRQYFTLSKKHPKVIAMVSNVDDFDYIECGNEVEALILECNLIKQYQPHYNILLRDDKHYPYVRVDFSQSFPVIEIVRKIRNDNAKYYGPFLNAYSIRELLGSVYRNYPVRSCRTDIERAIRLGQRPCLNYQMGRCLAPCSGKVSRTEYLAAVSQITDLLSGKYSELTRELKAQMAACSEELNFEAAAIARDKLRLIESFREKQRVTQLTLADIDYFAVATSPELSIVQGFFLRGGKLSATDKFTLSGSDDPEQVMSEFLKQHYTDAPVTTKIYVSCNPSDSKVIEQMLSTKATAKVSITVPERGEHKKLTDLAAQNAARAMSVALSAEAKKKERTVGAAQSLGEMLGLGFLKRIECFDISNTGGTDSVASMVVFVDGSPAKKEYRKFKIKTVIGSDDFASMAEVLTRRLLRGLKEGSGISGFGAMPNLIVADGGKGQLSACVEVLEGLGLEIPIIGLAKREEEIFLPHQSEPIVLPKTGSELRLLMAIRDEAHRFAVTFHRQKREERTLSSELDKIPGVGKARKLKLIRAFGDVANIKKCSEQKLAEVVGKSVAANIAVHFANGHF